MRWTLVRWLSQISPLMKSFWACIMARAVQSEDLSAAAAETSAESFDAALRSLEATTPHPTIGDVLRKAAARHVGGETPRGVGGERGTGQAGTAPPEFGANSRGVREDR